MKIKAHFKLLLSAILGIWFLVMDVSAQPIILISKDKNKEIQHWIERNSSKVRVIEFYHLSPDSQNIILKQAAGILMGGGEDIHPSYYGREDAIEVCGKIDPYRDSIEMVLLDYAKSKKIPVFGICRGLQIMNVRYGGTLIADIPSEMPSEIKHSQTGVDSAHQVKASEESEMFKAVGELKLVVNSTHHQAIKNLAPNFEIVAKANDGIIEAISYTSSNLWFAHAVQWHPERLKNQASDNLCKFFLSAVLERK